MENIIHLFYLGNEEDKLFKLRNQGVRIIQNTIQATLICTNKSGENILKPTFYERKKTFINQN